MNSLFNFLTNVYLCNIHTCICLQFSSKLRAFLVYNKPTIRKKNADESAVLMIYRLFVGTQIVLIIAFIFNSIEKNGS